MNIPYLLTGLAFVAVTVVFFGLFIKHLSRALALTGWDATRQRSIRRNTAIALISWGALAIVLALSGFAGNFNIFPANMAPLLVVPFVTIVVVLFSSKTRNILEFVPEKTIIQLQTFRFFVEI